MGTITNLPSAVNIEYSGAFTIENTLNNEFLTTGAANTYVGATARPLSSLDNRMWFLARFNVANTGASTIDIDSTGATAILQDDGTGALVALSGGEISTNINYILSYDGSQFQLFKSGGGGGGASTFADLDDTNITAVAADETLRWDGSDWVNSDLLQNNGVNVSIGRSGPFVSEGFSVQAGTRIRGAGSTSATDSLRVENSSASTAGLLVRDDGFVAINTTSRSSSTERMRVEGKLYVSGASTATTSDAWIHNAGDNTHLSVFGVGFIKQRGDNPNGAFIGVGFANRNVRFGVCPVSNIVDSAATQTYTTVYDQEADTHLRLGVGTVGFHFTDSNGGVAPGDTRSEVIFQSQNRRPMVVDNSGRVKLGGDTSATADQDIIVDTGFSPASVAAIRIKNITVTDVGNLSNPRNGMIVYVTNTDATFTSVGFWGRENSAWVKL